MILRPLKLNLQFFATPDDSAGFGGGDDTFVSEEQFASAYGETDNPEGAETPEGNPAETGQEQNSHEAQMYRIKHNGQEHEMSYEDLINHAQQGFDYTQKTQALSEKYKHWDEFEQQMAQHPQLAQSIQRQIEEYYNQANGQGQPQNNPQNPQQQQFQDPRYNELEKQLQQMQAYQAKELYQKEWSNLEAKYPDAKDLKGDIEELLNSNPNLSMEDAYRLKTYDQLAKKTQEEMVQKNMKKQIAQTTNKNVGAGNQGFEKPKSFDDVAKILSGGNYNLFT